MIVSDRFVFLHLHKSGGTFANECILRFVPGTRAIGYHLPRHMLPPEHAAKPILGLVRNPWSYYVSWYAFQAGRPEPNALFRVLSDNGRLGFEDTVRAMLELGGINGAMLERLVANLPKAYVGHGLNLPGFALAPIARSGLGFYSFLYRYMYGGDGAPARIATMERLRQDFPALIESAGVRPSSGMLSFLAGELPRNASQHGPYQGYYSTALRDLVAARDASVIQVHGYAFDG